MGGNWPLLPIASHQLAHPHWSSSIFSFMFRWFPSGCPVNAISEQSCLCWTQSHPTSDRDLHVKTVCGPFGRGCSVCPLTGIY